MSLLSGGTRPEEALHPERFQIGIGGEIISECGDFISESQAIWNRNDGRFRSESALYNIALAHQDTDIVIDLATKPAEGNHGADWEWWLVHGNKGLGFRVQAKRLFPNGRYKSLLTKKHGADLYQQLDTLVSASSSAGVEPLYCFFNFPHPQAQFNGPNLCNHTCCLGSFKG
jgi:hypothetical protein